MADTKRTQTEILSLLADNTSGAISPQDMRDTVVSMRANQGLGWEFHTETDNTEGDAQSISADTRTKILCDGLGSFSVTNYNADGGTATWDGVNSRFIPELHCAYLFRLTYKLKTASSAPDKWVSTELDIGAGGLGTGPVIWANSHAIIRGANTEQAEQFAIPMFAEEPFPTNGGTFWVESNVAITVWDVRVFWARLYSPDT